jgi:hypothetical protein
MVLGWQKTTELPVPHAHAHAFRLACVAPLENKLYAQQAGALAIWLVSGTLLCTRLLPLLQQSISWWALCVYPCWWFVWLHCLNPAQTVALSFHSEGESIGGPYSCVIHRARVLSLSVCGCVSFRHVYGHANITAPMWHTALRVYGRTRFWAGRCDPRGWCTLVLYTSPSWRTLWRHSDEWILWSCRIRTAPLESCCTTTHVEAVEEISSEAISVMTFLQTLVPSADPFLTVLV